MVCWSDSKARCYFKSKSARATGHRRRHHVVTTLESRDFCIPLERCGWAATQTVATLNYLSHRSLTTAMSDLTLKQVQPQASSSRPTPTKSLLNPWEFQYRPSPDGKDLNLLIMLHGLGRSYFVLRILRKRLNERSRCWQVIRATHLRSLDHH